MCKILCNKASIDSSNVINLHRTSEQYFQIYKYRLNRMGPLIEKNFSDRFPNKNLKPIKVENIKEKLNEEIFFIATIIRSSKKAITALDKFVLAPEEYEKKLKINISSEHISNENDKIYAEDETGRIEINTKKNKSFTRNFFTGLILGIIGKSDSNGNFIIENIIFPNSNNFFSDEKLNEISNIKNNNNKEIDLKKEDKNYILFASGLSFNCSDEKYYKSKLLYLKLAIQKSLFLINRKENEIESITLNLMGPFLDKKFIEHVEDLNYIKIEEKLTIMAEKINLIFNDLDIIIYNLLSDFYNNNEMKNSKQKTKLKVCVIPAISDLTNASFPILSFCTFFFKRCFEKFGGNFFFSLNNPSIIFEVFEGKEFNYILSCGENLRSIVRCSELEEEKEAFEILFKSSHLVPTTPLDLNSKVCLDCEESMCIEKGIDLYICGNLKSTFLIEKSFGNGNLLRKTVLLGSENSKSNLNFIVYGIESRTVNKLVLDID